MSPPANDAVDADPRVPRLALLIGPGLVLLLYFPTLFGTFLSDDFLVNTMLSHDADPRVVWDTVLADFSREWMGLENSGMYRPMVSLCFALNYALGGSDPFWFHLVNLLIHASTALLCALICVRCSTRRPALAAILGGALLAVHPAFGETNCWIAARNSGLQLMFATLAMLGFASYLRAGKRGWLGLSILGLVAALMTKETAVLLPFSFLALDVLIRGWPGVPRRALHLGMFGILAAYFVMRLIVLGVLLGGSSAGLESIQSGDILANLLAKTELLVAPIGTYMVAPWGEILGYLGGVGMAILVLPALLQTSTRWIVLLGVAWIGLHFAPSYKLVVDTDSLAGSRLIIGAAAVLAIVCSSVATRSRWTRLTNLGTVCLLTSLAALSLGRMTAFLRAYSDMGSLRKELNAAAADSDPAQPIGVVAINRAIDGVAFLNCNAVFPLLEKPAVDQDHPLVSLGFVFQPVPASEHLLFDVGPWRALREMGATMFEWHRDPNVSVARTVLDRKSDRPPEPLPILQKLTGGVGTRFVTRAALETFRIEALEIEVAGPCTGGRVEWLYFDAAGKHQEYVKFPVPAVFKRAANHAVLGEPTPRNANRVYYVDTSHLLTFLSVRLLGGLAGVNVHVEGEAVEVVGVRLLPRLDPLALPRRVAGTVTPIDNTKLQLMAPALPKGADSMTLYLMGPDTTLTLQVLPGPVQLPDQLQSIIAPILRASRQKRYYFYYEATGTRSWRSAVDWIVFRPR